MHFLKSTIFPPNYTITLLLIPSFLYGYDLGASGGILATITHHHALSQLESGLVISSIILGTLLGLLLSARLSQYLDYRTFMVISVMIYVIPTGLILLVDSVGAYIYFRIIIGCSIGMISFISPLYLHKIESLESNKSSFMALYQIWIGLGFCFAQLCLLLFYPFHSWEVIVVISLLPALFFLFQYKKIPVVTSSKEELQAQEFLGGEISIEKVSASSNITNNASLRDVSYRKKNTRRVAIAFLLAIAQQLTGDCIVTFYSPQIYHNLIQSEYDSLFLSFLSGLPGLISSSFSRKLAQKFSMKKIFIGGSCFISFGMVLLTLSVKISTAAFIFGFLGSSLILTSFPISWGAMLWPALTITLPVKNKERYMALCVGINSITVFLISTYTAYFLNKADMQELFICFIVINIVTAAIISKSLSDNFSTSETNDNE